MQTKQISIKGDFKNALLFTTYCKELGILNAWNQETSWQDFCKFVKDCTISKAEILYFDPHDYIKEQINHLTITKDILETISNSLSNNISRFKLKVYAKCENVEIYTEFQLGYIVSSITNCGLLIYEGVYNLLSVLNIIDSSFRKEFLKEYFQFILKVTNKNLLFIHTNNSKNLSIILDNIAKENVIGYDTPFANKNSGNKQQHYCINLNKI